MAGKCGCGEGILRSGITETAWTSRWKARLKGRAFLRADGGFLNGKIIASGSGIGYNGMDSMLCEVTKG